MENIKNVSKTYHHDFDEYFSRNVIDATRENPKQRIALLATGFANPENKEKIKKLLLCERECCKVASIKYGSKLYLSNKDIIAECLLSDDANLRENAVKLIRHMLNDGDTEIKDMVVNMRLMSNLSWLLGEVVRKGSFETKVKDIIKIMFSDKNIIDAALKNKMFVAGLPWLLGEVVRKGSFETKVKDIIKIMFSDKNIIDAELKNEIFVANLPSLLEEMVRKGSFETEAKDIIKIMFSDKNIIDAAFKNEIFVANLLSLLGEMATKESLKDEVNGIIENIFQGKY